MNTNQNLPPDASLAYSLLRVSLGLVIFLHGVARLAGHYQQFVDSTLQAFTETQIPAGAVHFAALCIPPAEVVLGFFIFTGLLTRLALIGGALLMILLLFGKSIQQDWTTVAIQLVYAFLYFVLLVFRAWNRFALDSLIKRNSN